MNIFIQIENLITPFNLTFKINTDPNLGDISINISKNPYVKDILLAKLLNLSAISNINITKSYLNIFVKPEIWLDHVINTTEDCLFDLNFNIGIHFDNDKSYLNRQIASIYFKNFSKLNCRIFEGLYNDKNIKQIIISNHFKSAFDNSIYKKYNILSESLFNIDSFIWGVFSVKNNQIVTIDFNQLNKICYSNKLFTVIYSYTRANYFLEKDIDINTNLTSSEIELIKLISYFPIIKKISFSNLEFYHIESYLVRLSNLFLNITDSMSYYRVNLSKKFTEIIESGLAILNIAPQRYL